MAATESVRVLRDQPTVFAQGTDSLFGPLDAVAEEPDCCQTLASSEAQKASRDSLEQLEEAGRVLREAGKLLASRRSMEAFSLMARYRSAVDYARISETLRKHCHTLVAKEFARELGTKSTINLLRHAREGAADTIRVREMAVAALEVLRSDQELAEAERANYIANLATLYGYLRDWQVQKKLCQEVLDFQSRSGGVDESETVRMKQHLAVACLNLGDWKAAKEISEEVLQVQIQQLGNYHVDVAWTKRHLGVACGNLGDKETAKALCRDALQVIRSPMGADHLEVARMLRSLGNALGDLDDWPLQRQLCEEALSYFSDILGDDHIDTALTKRCLGGALIHLGQREDAEKLCEKALVVLEQHLGEQHIDVARARCTLALARVSSEAQRELYTKALAVMEVQLGAEHVEVARIRAELATACAALGMHEEAVRQGSQSYEILRKQFPEDNIEVAWTKLHLADGVLNLDRTSDDIVQAAAWKKEALQVLEKAVGQEAVAEACAKATRQDVKESYKQRSWCVCNCLPAAVLSLSQ